MMLFELFSTIVPFRWVEKSEESYQAAFKIKNRQYDVYFAKDSSNGDEWWYVEFGIDSEAAGERPRYGITETGDAFVVFSTVATIIEDFIGKVFPKMIVFTAKESSRVKLYDALVVRIQKTGRIPFTVKTTGYPAGGKKYILTFDFK